MQTSDTNELLVARLLRASAVCEHAGLCDNEGFVWGGRRTAGGEDWVGWGPRFGTQALALRFQQMAAEQEGCRETLIAHSGCLSVRAQGESEDEEESRGRGGH